MKKSLFVIILMLSGFVAKAQHKIPVISNQDKDQIVAQATLDVKNFCFYLSDLADKKTSHRQKDSLKLKLQRLFTNNSTIVVKANPDDAGTAHPVPEYLTQVENYNYHDRLKVVAITFDQIVVDMSAGNLRDTTINGHFAYIGKFSFVQHFRVQQVEAVFNMAQTETPVTTKSMYITEWGDDTKKYGTIIIIPQKTSVRGAKYKVLLGDITAGEINMVKKKRV